MKSKDPRNDICGELYWCVHVFIWIFSEWIWINYNIIREGMYRATGHRSTAYEYEPLMDTFQKLSIIKTRSRTQCLNAEALQTSWGFLRSKAIVFCPENFIVYVSLSSSSQLLLRDWSNRTTWNHSARGWILPHSSKEDLECSWSTLFSILCGDFLW
jgi:hypothetical protein